jgi:hypothetical protein
MIHLQRKITPSKLPSSSSSSLVSNSFDRELLNEMRTQHNNNDNSTSRSLIRSRSSSNNNINNNRGSSRGRKVFGNSEPFLARMKLKVKDPYHGRVPSFNETITRLKTGFIMNRNSGHGMCYN